MSDNEIPKTFPRILYFDLENSPNLGWSWGKRFEVDIVQMEEESKILSFAYKFAGDKKVTVYSLPDFPLYATDPMNDKEIVQKLWEVLDSADVIIAHNGDNFDIKRAQARFIYHGLPPPSPFKSIDTLKLAKKHFSFSSNKLGDLCDFLGIGHKLQTGGISLWFGCMAGDPKSWAIMRKYNCQDVVLLEKVYEKFKPWATTLPRLAPYPNCGKCGGNLQRRGPTVSRTKGQQWRFQCQKCGSWSTGMDKAA